MLFSALAVHVQRWSLFRSAVVSHTAATGIMTASPIVPTGIVTVMACRIVGTGVPMITTDDGRGSQDAKVSAGGTPHD
jgi:hypothetical protein